MALGLTVVAGGPGAAWSQGTGSVFGAYRIRLEPGFQTVGLSLTGEPVLRGVVMSEDGSSESVTLAVGGGAVAERFEPGREYYAEVVGGEGLQSGGMVGHRFEIDEAATASAGGAGDVVVLDTLSRATTALSMRGLVGHRVEIKPHVVLGEVFPPEKLHADFSFAKADQVQVFNGLSFDTYYVLGADGSFAEWRKVGAVGDGAKNNLPLYPGEGVFFKRSPAGVGGGALELEFTGWVRQNPFRLPLAAGLNFVSGGHPASNSFADREALPGTFTGSFVFGDADQVSVHDGTSGYTKYYLLDDGAGFVRWVRFGGSFQSENETPVFDFRRATFITRNQPDFANRIGAPWTD